MYLSWDFIKERPFRGKKRSDKKQHSIVGIFPGYLPMSYSDISIDGMGSMAIGSGLSHEYPNDAPNDTTASVAKIQAARI